MSSAGLNSENIVFSVGIFYDSAFIDYNWRE